MRKFLLALLTVWFLLFCGSEEKIPMSPMVGAVAMRSALIWARADGKKTLSLRYFPAKGEKPVREVPGQKRQDGILHFELTGLEPGTAYEYRLLADGQPIKPLQNQRLTTKPLWKYREPNAPDFRFAFGSCHYVTEPPYDRKGKPFGSGYEIFSTIAKDEPAFFLWLGDNVYLREADWDSHYGIYARYAHTRALLQSQAFFAALPQFAIWDDHDFGPNDASRSYTLSAASTQAMRPTRPNS